jgi:hypothetical protein
MECVYVVEAKYVKDFTVYLIFNTGEAGEADLKDIVYKYNNAEPLRTPSNFRNFYLDSWPTLAWDCGFDISPESLYYKVTGKEQN